MLRTDRPSPLLRALGLVLACAGPLRAQEPATPPDDRELARTLAFWASLFETDRIEPDYGIPFNEVSEALYGDAIAPNGYLTVELRGEATHFGALKVLAFLAEESDSTAVAKAVLRVAAVGFEKSLHDHRVAEIRELGHWTLVRARGRSVETLLLRAASGARFRHEDGGSSPLGVAMQVAALRILGQKNLDPARPILESRLLASDARIRLAAAEALSLVRRLESLKVLPRALVAERHPVVAQALVRAIDRVLRRHGGKLEPEERHRAVRAVLRTFGRAGWRTDLAIVELAERHPVRDSIPALIEIYARADSTADELLAAVNEQASPILRHRAWQALRRLTGAILPFEDPEAWRDFWNLEKDNIVLPENPGRSRARIVTKSDFFGIPIVGREVAFVIDVSGSMKESAPSNQNRGGSPSSRQRRLDVAREQVLHAVHGLPDTSRYHLISFSDDVLRWNPEPVPPSEASHRALTECVGQFAPLGGTDVFGALMSVLAAQDVVFGQPSQNAIDEVFLLSDGEPTEGEVTEPERILELTRLVNRYQRIRVHTVFIGDGEGAELMRRLAGENDGIFVQR